MAKVAMGPCFSLQAILDPVSEGMTQWRRILSGKVRLLSLPNVALPVPPGTPLLKRLMLPQGELAQCHDGSRPIHYIACVELVPGTLRGNHFHRTKEEFVYVICGEVELHVQDIQSGALETVRLRAGDLVFIETSIAHVLKPVSVGRAIEYSEAPYDPGDVFPHQLL